MNYENRGFTVIEVPPLTAEVLAQYETLPMDQYCDTAFRFRRFSQYKLKTVRGEWALEILPQRVALQSREINHLVGGMQRHFEPLQFDPTPQIAAVARAIHLDASQLYQLNVHQVRVVVSSEIAGTTVPEGPHRDGHETVAVIVFRRSNISGGVTQLLPTGGGKPFFETVLAPNQALVFDDGRMWHNATDILTIDQDKGGFRDVWLLGLNRWDCRRYGPEFELVATA